MWQQSVFNRPGVAQNCKQLSMYTNNWDKGVSGNLPLHIEHMWIFYISRSHSPRPLTSNVFKPLAGAAPQAWGNKYAGQYIWSHTYLQRVLYHVMDTKWLVHPTLCVMCHMSYVMCYVSRVTFHVSPVTCHLSRVTNHMFFFVFFSLKKIGQSGGARRWRVCYQQGLPRVVERNMTTQTGYQ